MQAGGVHHRGTGIPQPDKILGDEQGVGNVDYPVSPGVTLPHCLSEQSGDIDKVPIGVGEAVSQLYLPLLLSLEDIRRA